MVRSSRQVVVLLALVAFAFAQDYTPKFPGDPARSNSEAAALGYMRVVVNAERQYHKRHAQYATSLAALVNQGSFTKRMVNPNRGDYTARFKSDGKGFSLWMTPTAAPSPTQRAFYVDDRGTIRAEEDKSATAESPSVKAEK
jgi:type II secretory pathway pseudopilin PulG